MMSAPKPKFAYKDVSGKKQSVEIVDKYQSKKIVRPLAKIDSNIDPKLCRAATIAQERANAHSHSLCWEGTREQLWVQKAPGFRSIRGTRRRRAGLWRQARSWSRRDSHPGRIRERFSLKNSIASSPDRRLRKGVDGETHA